MQIMFLVSLILVVSCFPKEVLAKALPTELSLEQIERIDFSRADLTFKPLFPDKKADREKILLFLGLYNQAIKTIGDEEKFDFGYTFFIPEVEITLNNGEKISFYLYDDGVYFPSGFKDGLCGFHVKDEELGKKLSNLVSSYVLTSESPEETELNSYEVRLGEKVTVKSSYARGEAKIYLKPMGSTITNIKSDTEVIFIDKIPTKHDKLSYTFTLKEEIGKKKDGTAGKIGPGEWMVVVSTENNASYLPIKILPRETSSSLAVAYDNGRVYVWNESKIRSYKITNPANQPLLTNSTEFADDPITHISFDFLEKALEIPVSKTEDGKFMIGKPELGLTIKSNENKAYINGTELLLGSILKQYNGVWELPFDNICQFFDYKVKWQNPEQVVFLRNLEDVPRKLQEKLNKENSTKGKNAKVHIKGKKLSFNTKSPFIDPTTGKIMVPLRETVEALGGKIEWKPIKDEDFSYHKSAGKNVTSYTKVTLNDRVWGIYQKPTSGQTTVVSLRQLAQALGYKLEWDGKNKAVNLVE